MEKPYVRFGIIGAGTIADFHAEAIRSVSPVKDPAETPLMNASYTPVVLSTKQ